MGQTTGSTPTSAAAHAPRVALALAAGVSLIVLRAPDVGLFSALFPSHPTRVRRADGGQLAVKASELQRFLFDWRIASLAIVVLLYVLSDGGKTLRLPSRESARGVLGVAAGWLVVVVFGAFVLHKGTVDYSTLQNALQFAAVGVLIEELLFRGVVFGLAEKAFAGTRIPAATAAIVISAALFGLGHLQYFGFSVATTWRLRSYTPLMGLVLGWLRSRTESIWPSVSVHAVGNVLAIVAGST
jgi:membrane protease YdiL (CAAX protease family)